jgi:hypothetical protein
MPRGRVLYMPETSQGRLVFLGEEIPVRVEDVAMDARRPGTRVRFDLIWESDDLRVSNVRRTRGPWARERWSPAQARDPSMGGGSER